MKKIFLCPGLFLLFVFTGLTGFSQSENNVSVIKIYGGGNKIETSGGTVSNNFTDGSKGFDLGVSYEYHTSSILFLGVAFDYANYEEPYQSELFINNFYQISQTNLNSVVWSPSFNIGLYKELVNNLYFKFYVNFAYAKIHQEDESLVAEAEMLLSGIYNISNCVNPPTYQTFSHNKNTDYLSFALVPEFDYFFNSWFGLSLSLGGFEYGIFDNEIDSNIWTLNFKPSNWTFGCNVRF